MKLRSQPLHITQQCSFLPSEVDAVRIERSQLLTSIIHGRLKDDEHTEGSNLCGSWPFPYHISPISFVIVYFMFTTLKKSTKLLKEENRPKHKLSYNKPSYHTSKTKPNYEYKEQNTLLAAPPIPTSFLHPFSISTQIIKYFSDDLRISPT